MFELPKELVELQQKVKLFREKEVMSYEDGWPARYTDAPKDIVDMWKKKVRTQPEYKGLINTFVPKEFGGFGHGSLAYALLCEEASRSAVPILFLGIFGCFHGVNPSLYTASDYQKERYLWPTLRGEKDWGVAYTEPGAGSDLAAMEATAVRKGDKYVLNAHKIFASKSATCDYMIVGAYTDKSLGHRGMSTFIVDTDTPGFKVIKELKILGGQTEEELILDNCEIPAENMIDPRGGSGFALAMEHFNKVGRLGAAANALGMAERAFEMAIDYAKKRHLFGKHLGQFQGIQWILAQDRLDLETMKWLVYHTAWKADQGQDIRLDAAMCKLHCVMTAHKVVDDALQIHGGVGLNTDAPLAKFYNALRTTRLAEGSMEIMKVIIAREILGKEMTR
jgi:alkylation response protein AidB-like acyl-CoA dehydrogenase